MTIQSTLKSANHYTVLVFLRNFSHSQLQDEHNASCFLMSAAQDRQRTVAKIPLFWKSKRMYGKKCIFAVRNEAMGMDKQQLQQIIAAYFATQPVLKAWLFGSYARGEQREDSDVDIMVVLDSEAHVGLFKLSGMRLDLQDLLSREVDLVTEKGLLPFARQSAENDKILLYERAN